MRRDIYPRNSGFVFFNGVCSVHILSAFTRRNKFLFSKDATRVHTFIQNIRLSYCPHLIGLEILTLKIVVHLYSIGVGVFIRIVLTFTVKHRLITARSFMLRSAASQEVSLPYFSHLPQIFCANLRNRVPRRISIRSPIIRWFQISGTMSLVKHVLTCFSV